MPLFIVFILNIILYLLYVVFTSVVFSFIFPRIRRIMDMPVLNPIEHVDLYNGVQVFIFIAVFVISLLFFRFFYLGRNIKLQKGEDNEYINGIRLMVTLANAFLAIIYTVITFVLVKVIGRSIESMTTIVSNTMIIFIISIVGLVISIFLRRFTYFTMKQDNKEYIYEEVEVSETYTTTNESKAKKIKTESVIIQNTATEEHDELQIKIK